MNSYRLRLEVIAFAAGDGVKDIARHANLSSTYVSKIVNHHVTPSDKILQLLAAHYRVGNPASLLDRIDAKTLHAAALS